LNISKLEKDVIDKAQKLRNAMTGSIGETSAKAEFDVAVALLESESSRVLAQKIQDYTEVAEHHAITSKKSQKSSKRSEKISMLAAVISALVAVYQVTDWQVLITKWNGFLAYFQ
jgi:hypothetical protein